jgi:hypothetical protein
MSQEKYMSNYVDLLKSTLNDQISRNLQLQATAKTQGEIITEMSAQVTNAAENLQVENSQALALATQKQQELSEQVNSLTKRIEQLNVDKQSEVVKLTEYFKNQIAQSNTDRASETSNYKKTLADLTKRINELQIANIEYQNQLTAPNNIQTELENTNILVENLKAELVSMDKELSHMDTLKNQLINTQGMVQERDAIIDELNATIENLKTTPTKKKKTSVELDEPVSTLETATQENGGSF